MCIYFHRPQQQPRHRATRSIHRIVPTQASKVATNLSLYSTVTEGCWDRWLPIEWGEGILLRCVWACLRRAFSVLVAAAWRRRALDERRSVRPVHRKVGVASCTGSGDDMTSWDAVNGRHHSVRADGALRYRWRHLRLPVFHPHQPVDQGTPRRATRGRVDRLRRRQRGRTTRPVRPPSGRGRVDRRRPACSAFNAPVSLPQAVIRRHRRLTIADTTNLHVRQQSLAQQTAHSVDRSFRLRADGLTPSVPSWRLKTSKSARATDTIMTSSDVM